MSRLGPKIGGNKTDIYKVIHKLSERARQIPLPDCRGQLHYEIGPVIHSRCMPVGKLI